MTDKAIDTFATTYSNIARFIQTTGTITACDPSKSTGNATVTIRVAGAAKTTSRVALSKRMLIDMKITAHSNFANLNGANFYYEVAGTGDPLVLVHAGICDSRMWDDQFAHFAKHYQVIRYDARGYGQSKPVDGSFAYRDDLHALLTDLEIERAHLIGCSFGGTTCLDFALAYPEMVDRLVLVDSTPSGYQSAQPLPAQLAAVDAAVEAGDFDQAAEHEVQIWVDGPTRNANEVSPAIRQRVHAMNLIALRNEALDLGQPVPLDPPAAQRLQALQAATLLVVGALDQPRTRAAIDWMATQIPNAQKHVIEHAAHLPNMEKPEEFNWIVLDFLGREDR